MVMIIIVIISAYLRSISASKDNYDKINDDNSWKPVFEVAVSRDVIYLMN